MFFRQSTDGTRLSVPLEGLYAGPITTPCWIIGGGPSLTAQMAEQIVASAAPRFCINLAGSGLFRPHFWTSYDPTARFHRSIYLDAGVTKFVHSGRAMDLVPETTFKVCDCPNQYFIDRTQERGFANFPGTGSSPITDWQDSLIQAIEIAYRLGFRELYLAGCEMKVPPSRELTKAAQSRHVEYRVGELLADFVARCEKSGINREEIEQLATASQYHFEEKKALSAAIQTDSHYFRVAQTLRLCRRAMGLAGLQLISVTRLSRLNDHFPVISVSQARRRIATLAGDPQAETTAGRYSKQMNRRPQLTSPMKDVRPHYWQSKKGADQKGLNENPHPPEKTAAFAAPKDSSRLLSPVQRLRDALDQLPAIPIDLNEEG